MRKNIKSGLSRKNGRSKYGNRQVAFANITFDSIAERDRYIELTLLQSAGKIRDLQLQPEFELLAKQPGERLAKYTADFVYFDVEPGRYVVEDVKSAGTAKEPAYILRRKLFKQNNRQGKYAHEYVFREVLT
jgi:hypothetical protein